MWQSLSHVRLFLAWILQARILEWVAGPFSRGSSQPRDQTQVFHIAGVFFTSWATREAQEEERGEKEKFQIREQQEKPSDRKSVV